MLLGAGDGTFAPARNVATGVRPIMVAVADFNGDANQDVAVANAGSSNVSVLAGNGDGTFGSPLRLPLDAAPSAIIAADVNHDLYADLAVGSSGGITVLRGTGLGTFLPALTSPAAVVTIADFVAIVNVTPAGSRASAK